MILKVDVKWFLYTCFFKLIPVRNTSSLISGKEDLDFTSSKSANHANLFYMHIEFTKHIKVIIDFHIITQSLTVLKFPWTCSETFRYWEIIYFAGINLLSRVIPYRRFWGHFLLGLNLKLCPTNMNDFTVSIKR